MKRLGAALLLLAASLGCDDFGALGKEASCRADPSTCEDGGGPPPDAGQTDAGQTDAGQTDAGQTDAGQTDAGQTDAGQTDAGQTDAGQTDAGPADAGQTDAGPADAGPADAGGSGFFRRDGGPTLGGGLFFPLEFTTRGSDAGNSFGSSVAAYGRDIAWTWFTGAGNPGTLEIVRNDGGLSSHPTPFLPTAVATLDDWLLIGGRNSSTQVQAFNGDGTRDAGSSWLVSNQSVSGLTLFYDGGTPVAVAVSESTGSGPFVISRFDLPGLSFSTGVANAPGVCPGASYVKPTFSPTEPAVYVAARLPMAGCGPVDAGSALMKFAFNGAMLAGINLGASASVAGPSVDGKLWVAHSSGTSTSIGRRDPGTLAELAAPFVIAGSVGVTELVATPADVFFVGRYNGGAISFDGGSLPSGLGLGTLIFQFDPSGALRHWGMLNLQDSSVDSAAWVDGRLVVTGSCAGTQDGGPCDGPLPRAFLFGVEP